MPKRLTTEDFITKAKEVHGDKFDYSLVTYIGAHTKVKIICPIHGEFTQPPNDHLKGFGCCKCSRKCKHTLNTFIEKANEVHNGRYDYSLVGYKNNKTNVKIICKTHGVFTKRPDTHLQGYGCPQCLIHKNKIDLYRGRRTVLYVVDFGVYNTVPIIKIGITLQDVEHRFKMERIQPTILYNKIYEDGSIAFIKEQLLLHLTSNFTISKNISQGLLYKGGSIELRHKDALELIVKELGYV